MPAVSYENLAALVLAVLKHQNPSPVRGLGFCGGLGVGGVGGAVRIGLALLRS